MRAGSKHCGEIEPRSRPGPVGARVALLACALVMGFAWPAPAQETLEVPITAIEGGEGAAIEGGDGAAASPPAPESPPPDVATEREAEVELDALLRLPNSLDFKEERRGGDGAADWRRRFKESEEQVADARQKLAETEAALDEAATSGSGQWQIAPPGQQANSENNGPISFKLREDLRRARNALEEAERRHRALVVQADLADVPAAWRDTSAP